MANGLERIDSTYGIVLYVRQKGVEDGTSNALEEQVRTCSDCRQSTTSTVATVGHRRLCLVWPVQL